MPLPEKPTREQLDAFVKENFKDGWVQMFDEAIYIGTGLAWEYDGQGYDTGSTVPLDGGDA